MEAVPPDGRGVLEHLLIPSCTVPLVRSRRTLRMRLCYFSGFQGRVYANNVFAFIVVVVLGFLFVFCSRLYLRLTLKIKNYFADIVLVSQITQQKRHN